MRKSRKISSATGASPSRTGTPQASQVFWKDLLLLSGWMLLQHQATDSKLLLLRFRNCTADKAALPPFVMSTSLLKTSFALPGKKDLFFVFSYFKDSGVSCRGKLKPGARLTSCNISSKGNSRTGWPGM